MTRPAHHRTEQTGTTDGPAATSSPAARQAWALAVPVLVLALLLLNGLLWRTWASLVHTWSTSDTYGHGFAILPLCGYLLWRRRHAAAAEVPAPCYWAMPAMGIAALAWLLGAAGAILVVQQFALVAMIQLLFVIVLGPRIVAKIAFPLLYLFFAVPFGSFLVAPLQTFTAHFVDMALTLTGVPVHLDGVFIDIPAARFNVAEACAGLRFLIVSVALGVLGAHLFYRSWVRRCLFVAAAIVVPIIANGLRAYGIVMIAHVSGTGWAARIDHVTYGFVFLSFVLLVLLATGLVLADRKIVDWSADPDALPATTAPDGTARAAPALTSYAGAAAGALLLVIAAVAAGTGGARDDSDGVLVDLPMPAARTPWRPVQHAASDWRPVFPGADAERAQTYASGSEMVALYVAYYRYERQGAEVVNEQNQFADPKAWKQADRGTMQLTLCRAPQTVRYVRLVSGARERRIAFWYWVDGEATSNRYVAKLLRLRSRLLGGIGAAAVVALAADDTGSQVEAEAAIQDLLDHVEPLSVMLERIAVGQDQADGRRGAAASACARG